jgi:uncharacterized protein YecE (DUF72 family)
MANAGFIALHSGDNRRPEGRHMIWIGTSGFQYPEWKGTFYPEKFATKKMLAFYAGHFPTTEINYSFYRIPAGSTLEAWASETPPKFRFTLKAPKQITHIQQLRDCREVLLRFWSAAGELNEKLGIILFQLPPFFKKDLEGLKKFLDELPPGMKSTFEFRHASWFDEEVFAVLRSSGAALCIADSEKLKTPCVFTAEFGYFRLRDEGYTAKDLERWAEIISGQQKDLKETYVYFKHEESGVGPQFAKQLMSRLGIEAPN